MKNYLNSFYDEFDYPSDARVALNEGYDKIHSSPKSAEIFDGIIAGYAESHTLAFSGMKEGLDLASELSGVHIYTVHLLIHICLSKELRAWYAENNLDDALWVGAMSDLKWKLLESNIVKHVWGTFVADGNWFSRWYDLSRFAFCRLQFEIIPFNREYEKNGLKLTKESKVINVHIPRTETPLSHDEVQRSYSMAKEFFKKDFGDEPIVFRCSSWLLFPEHEKILHEKSNIRKFMADYDIYASGYYDEVRCSTFWRIFDCPEDTPMDDIPEDSFLKRAYKEYIKNGGKLGYGAGVFLAKGVL